MPCYDSRDDDNSELYTKINRLTRVACDMAKVIKTVGQFGRLSFESRQWVAEHEALDRQHRREELAARRKEEVRRNALMKLTDVERAVLGFKPRTVKPRS